MKYVITSALAAVLFAVSGSLLAWSIEEELHGKSESTDKDYPYRGSSGERYQYDLSKPGDQIRYEIDLGAQMRDELSVSPRRELDRDLDQYGGGIKR